ncbi:MAG: carbon starvation protein A [Planctomycetes bacterium]|nr:carbon starvation protein A [Planctomycetota bacterium]
MSLPLLAVIVIAALVVGYLGYGRLVARQLGLDPGRVTPAHEKSDGEDYIPTRPFYLLSQHFSAIAAAGPIVGPIAACLAFGWLPCLLWICLGTIFIGAVHDFTALFASVRHGAGSVAQIVRANLGPRAWLAIMAFIWIALIYVIVAFTSVTAKTFVGATLEGVGETPFNAGGAVAAAATMYLGLALVMGLAQKWLKPPLWLVTVLFVPATLGVVWLGTEVSTALVFGPAFDALASWGVLILAYCFVASLLPMWLLLQPRGYLGGFVLYLALGVGTVGILFGGYEVKQPAFTGFVGASGDWKEVLFPFLFVTIACGACSGFHGLVCSGTTSKQVDRETHCHPIGYGAMLLEGFVAVIALATVLILSPDEAKGKDIGKLYGNGIGKFLAVIIGGEHERFATVFGAMAFSTFVFDTLDVATRLGRYILQELFGAAGRVGAVAATALTAGVPLLLVVSSGKADAWKDYWTLFGTSNQLLAALTLLGVTVWLKKSGKPFWFTLGPMIFVMAITLWSLGAQAWAIFNAPAGLTPVMKINGVVCVVLAALAALLVVEALRAMRRAPALGEVARG